MGLLDRIVGGVLGGGSAPGGDAGTGAGPMDSLQLLMTLLAGGVQGGGLGGGQGAGLAGLLEQLSAAGLGDDEANPVTRTGLGCVVDDGLASSQRHTHLRNTDGAANSGVTSVSEFLILSICLSQ